MEKEKVATADAITTKANAKVEKKIEITNFCDPENFISAEKMLSMEDKSVPCLFDPIIPKVGLGLLGGESDAGKSMFLRQLAICAALGSNFFGFQYRGCRNGVLYISTEDAMEPSSVFLRKQYATFRKEPSELKNLHFLFSATDILKKLSEWLQKVSTELVILDSLSDLFDERDMNSSAQVRKFFKPYRDLAQTHNSFFLFLHHIGKGKEEMPTKNSYVGSQSTEAIMRVCFLLLKDPVFDDFRHFCIVKHNYLGSEYKNKSWKLRFSSETFTFQDTGDRVPFDDLASNATNPKKSNIKEKTVTSYADDNQFIHFVNENLKNAKTKTVLISLLTQL